MFNPSRPLGRLPFFGGLSAVNTAILVAATAALTILPAGAGHVAVIVVVGGLQAVWFALHARRFADAGHGPGWPLGMTLALFAIFAGGYLLVASLWSVPEVQQEAFRTAGGIGGGRHAYVETSEAIIAAGRALASVMGAAGAVLFTGVAVFVMGLAAAVSAVFSIVALALPSRRIEPAPPALRADHAQRLTR